MKKLMLSLLLCSIIAVNAQETVRDQSVVIYNQNVGVVHETRSMELKKGINTYTVTDVPERIDPTSVKINLDADILEQNFKYDLASVRKVLSKYINKEVTLIGQQTISGELLSISDNQLIIRKSSGGLIMLSDLKNYQIAVNELPAGFIAKPALDWKINSTVDKKTDYEMTYRTDGMNWHAEYVAMLDEDEKLIDINSWISLENNSGMTYKDVKLKLIAGDVNIIRNDYYEEGYERNLGWNFKDASARASAEKFSDYYMYNIEKPMTLANNEIKQLAMFDASKIAITKTYVYYVGTNSNLKNANPNVKLKFENTDKNNLGLPLPMGKISVFKKSDKGSILLGEDRIAHTPKNETVTANIGKAFDIVIDKNIIKTEKISNNYSIYTIEIEIRNRKDSDVIVDVIENFPDYNLYEIVESSISYTEKVGNNYTFKVPVKKDSVQKLTIKYSVKYQ